MADLSENPVDQERVERLNQQGKKLSLLGNLSFGLSGAGAGSFIYGYLKKNATAKTAGAIGFLSGIAGAAYSFFQSKNVSAELSKPENANVALLGKPIYNETKDAIKGMVQDPATMDALLSNPNPTSEDIRNIAKEAMQRSPAIQELNKRAKNLDPEAKKGLHNYMQGLKEAVAKIDTKKSKPQDTWEESVKTTDSQNAVER